MSITPESPGNDMPVMASARRAVQISKDISYRDVIDTAFLARAVEDGLAVVAGSGWMTDASVDDAPGVVIARASYFHAASTEVLVNLHGGLAHLIQNDRSLVVRVAAPSQADAERIKSDLMAALPASRNDAEGEVNSRFWWWDQQRGVQGMARTIHVPAWEAVSRNYVGDAADLIGQMAEWHEPPPGGRLVLWHGPPGTGKTTALRALANAWRTWAEFQFITDPEQFLQQPSYLMAAIRQDAGPLPRTRWNIIVLEDAGEFLQPDAKRVQGQQLSRLLNTCDGVLGQGARALLVVTTNEPLSTLHPAVSRPGRCLAEAEFGPFSAGAAKEWCDAHGAEQPTGSRAWTLAELFAWRDGRTIGRAQDTPIGFAA